MFINYSAQLGNTYNELSPLKPGYVLQEYVGVSPNTFLSFRGVPEDLTLYKCFIEFMGEGMIKYGGRGYDNTFCVKVQIHSEWT